MITCRNCGRKHPEKYIGNQNYCIKMLNQDKEILQHKVREVLKLTPKGLKEVIIPEDPIHGYFELSYAQYLTIPRSILQSMPTDWQERFVGTLRDLDETFDWRPQELSLIHI